MIRDLIGALLMMIYAGLCVQIVKSSILTFNCFKLDKQLSKNLNKSKNIRLSEQYLMSLIVSGGALGAMCGMIICRHKTLKVSFWLTSMISIIGWTLLLSISPFIIGIIYNMV